MSSSLECVLHVCAAGAIAGRVLRRAPRAQCALRRHTARTLPSRCSASWLCAFPAATAVGDRIFRGVGRSLPVVHSSVSFTAAPCMDTAMFGCHFTVLAPGAQPSFLAHPGPFLSLCGAACCSFAAGGCCLSQCGRGVLRARVERGRIVRRQNSVRGVTDQCLVLRARRWGAASGGATLHAPLLASTSVVPGFRRTSARRRPTRRASRHPGFATRSPAVGGEACYAAVAP